MGVSIQSDTPLMPVRRGLLAGGLALLLPGPAWAREPRVYVAKGGQPIGPFRIVELHAHIRSRAEAATTLVWHEGMADWAPASRVTALAAFVASLPEKTPVDAAAFVIGTWYSKDTALLLQEDEGMPIHAVPGEETFVFNPDLSYAYSGYAQHLNSWIEYGPPPGEGEPPVPKVVEKHVIARSSSSGTYSVSLTEWGEIAIAIKGKGKTLFNSKESVKFTDDETRTMRIISPTHMRSDEGANFVKLQ